MKKKNYWGKKNNKQTNNTSLEGLTSTSISSSPMGISDSGGGLGVAFSLSLNFSSKPRMYGETLREAKGVNFLVPFRSLVLKRDLALLQARNRA